MGIKGQYDDVSSSTTYLPLAILFIFSLIVSLFLDLREYTWVVLGAVAVLGILMLFWRTLAVRPRLWVYNLLRRWKERSD